VRLKRCAQGISLLVILLSACAFILDDLAVLFAAGSLLAGLCGLGYLFDRRFRQAVASVRVERSPERSVVRTGTTIRMITAITLQVPAHMQVQVSEILPAGVVVQDGQTNASYGTSPAPVTFRLAYRITPVVHGTMHFSGVRFVAQDYFFEESIVLSAEPFRGPSLSVQPRGLFEPSGRGLTAETREIEKMALLSGLGVRAMREYYAGDDLRRIDWKLTAKHNKLFVREYTGVVNLSPLIVVDLPWRGAPYPSDAFERMVAAVAGMVEHSTKMYQYATVLLISGPNILHLIIEEKDLQRSISALREWMHPVERAAHFYRMADRSDLRTRIRALEARSGSTPDPSTRKFLTSLKKQYHSSLGAQQTHTFNAQVGRALSPLTVDEVFVFSLFVGDASHLVQFIRQAKAAKLRVHVRAPRVPDPVSFAVSPGRLGADTVEAFA
jgi:uncharacterized protein (DUF58 family)